MRFQGLKTIVGAAVLGALALGLADVTCAQGTTASVSGRVSDESGGALPGATVTITNADTNVTVWSGPTDGTGLYNAPSVPVGRYNISASLTGFKSVTVEGVPIEVGQRANIPVQLPAGEVRETITVVGETLGRLERDDSSMGLVVTTSQVKNLPLAGRNILSLLTLAGGVSTNNTAGVSAGSINSSQLSINGSRTVNNEIAVDGVSVISGSTGAPNRLPSTEAIREFKVLSAGYSAEFGRTSGGYVNVVIDSGTNQLHGGVYEFYRNEKFNANNFFNNLRNVARPNDRYHQYGAKLGGPVRLPGIYRGDDKTFFFVNYEAVRRETPFSNLSTLPDAQFRLGDFSASPVLVKDPLLPGACSAADRSGCFPNNQIPAARIDPAARRILSLLPQPNSSGSVDAANGRRTNNYVNEGTNEPTEDEFTIRLDHNAGSKARFFGRLTYYNLGGAASETVPGFLNNNAGPTDRKGYQSAVGWTHVWSPAVLSDVNVGFMRDDPVQDPPSLGMDVRAIYGIQRSAFAASPRFAITGWRELGINANTYQRQINNNVQTSFSLTWVHGNHTTKIGSQVRLNQFNVFNPGGDFTGVYNFTGEITSPARTGGNPVQSMADFLLGAVKTSAYELAQPATGRRNHNLGAYIQNDWKITPRLTLNAGVRYEYEAPMVVDNDVHSRLDIRPGSVGKLLVAGLNSTRSLDLEASKVNLAPRVGFAYTLNEKTVLRSAFGIFYGQIFSNLGGIVLYPGFTVRTEFPSLGTGIPQAFTLAQGHPLTGVQNFADPFFVERQATAARPLSVQGGGNNQFGAINPLPSTMLWNLGIQRELLAGTIIDLSYVGSRGRNLPVLRNQNTVPVSQLQTVAQANTALAAQQARTNPNVTSFAAFVHEGKSWYNSGQVRLSRTFSQRFSFQSTYTFSKAIDDGSGIFNFSQPNGLDVGDLAGFVDPKINRGLSALDRTHLFTAAARYETGGSWLVRGFQFNVLALARSGVTDTVSQTNLHDINTIPSLPGGSALQQRPNVKPGASTDVSVPATPDGTAIRVLMSPADPNFPFTPSGPFFATVGGTRRLVVPFTGPGSLGKSTVRGPSEFNIDFGVARRFDLGSRVGLTIRAEAFNVLNHTNLNNPNTSLTVAADANGNAVFNSPTFGQITTAKSARFMQLVGRIDF